MRHKGGKVEGASLKIRRKLLRFGLKSLEDILLCTRWKGKRLEAFNFRISRRRHNKGKRLKGVKKRGEGDEGKVYPHFHALLAYCKTLLKSLLLLWNSLELLRGWIKGRESFKGVSMSVVKCDKKCHTLQKP